MLLASLLISMTILIESAPVLCEGDSDLNSAEEVYGYNDWETLRYDISQLNDNETINSMAYEYSTLADMSTFVICPNSFIVVDGDNSTIKLPLGMNTNIKCGTEGLLESNCTISGGQFLYLFETDSSGDQALVNIEISGLSMVNSSKASIEVLNSEAVRFVSHRQENSDTSNGTSVVSIINCRFSNNSGRPIHLNTKDILVIVDRCTFTENDSFAAVHIEQGEAFIVSSIFLFTNGNAIWISSGGTLSLQNSCLIDNQQTVTIESDSILLMDQTYGNYVERSIDGSSCLGFFLLVDTTCQNFDATSCVIINAPSMEPSMSTKPTESFSPTLSPSFHPSVVASDEPTYSNAPSSSPRPTSRPTSLPSLSPTKSQSPSVSFAPTRRYCNDGSEGYLYWLALLNDVQSSAGNEKFIICPQTVLKPEVIDYGNYNASDISIYASDIIIQCGESGLSENTCIFDGGLSHFFFGGNANNVTILGITFRFATDSSILAFAKSSASVTFDDCIFEENYGLLGSAITAKNDANIENPGMNVVLKSCLFKNNVSPLATILSYGLLHIEESIIQSTSSSNGQGWAIVMSGFGQLYVSTSCFEDNINAIFLLDDAKLENNSENFGFNNTIGIGSCNGVFIDSYDECSPFSSQWCNLYAAPSEAPSLQPSSKPIGPPTLKPTTRPTHSTYPSSNPIVLPSNSSVPLPSQVLFIFIYLVPLLLISV